jgi:hypothetical protein
MLSGFVLLEGRFMISAHFRGLSRQLAVIAGLTASLLSLGATSSLQPTDGGAQLSSLVGAALTQAPLNFAAWRSGAKQTDDSQVSYRLSPVIKRQCSLCGIYDEYAAADADERYALQFNWGVPKSWSRAQTIAYIELHIGALVPSFTATQGTNDGGDSWFDWQKPSAHQFVYVETYSDSKNAGFMVRVGHFLPTNIHWVPYARLSSTQRADLAQAVRNFVQIGIQDGSDNFTSLRGTPTDKTKTYFDTSVTFGEFMKSCDVNGDFANESASGGTSKWFLECDTPSLGGAKSDIIAIIQSAIAGVLPSDFTVTTDPTYLGMSDYRWDRSSDSMAVEVSTYDNDDGTFDYHVQVVHFTT